MKMKIEDGQLFIIEVDNTQYSIITSWNLTRWDRQRHCLIGTASADLLNRLASVFKLPDVIEAERKRLNDIQAAVDSERMKEEPEPLYKYPVKIPLFKHQIRGANMALLTFGLIERS